MSLTIDRPQPVPLDMDRDGVVLVAGTRVTLDTVVQAFRDGATAEEIGQQYPSLALADIYSVLGYYLRHQMDINAYLAARAEAGDTTRRQNEVRFDPQGVRDRLLARRPSGYHSS